MPQLRIKIDQLHNGETKYSVQEAYLEITGGWIKRQRIVWRDLYTNMPTEEEAIHALESYRKFYEKKEGEKVKSTTYKTI